MILPLALNRFLVTPVYFLSRNSEILTGCHSREISAPLAPTRARGAENSIGVQRHTRTAFTFAAGTSLAPSAVSTLFSESNSLTKRRPVGMTGMLLELWRKVTGDRFVTAKGDLNRWVR